MDTYEQKRGRWNLFLGTVGIGAFAGAVAGRRQLANVAMQGLESLAKKYASVERQQFRFSINTIANQAQGALRDVKLRAASQVGERAFRQNLQQANWGNDLIDALLGYENGIVSQTRLNKVLSTGRFGIDTLHTEEFAAFRGLAGNRQIQNTFLDIQRARAELVPLFRAVEDTGSNSFIRQLSGQSIGGMTPQQIQAQVTQAERTYRRMMRESLATRARRDRGFRDTLQGQGSWTDWILQRATGSRRVTFEDALAAGNPLRLSSEQITALSEARTTLKGQVFPGKPVTHAALNNLEVGELWRTGTGEVRDLRGVGNLLRKVEHWAGENLQIPFIPYVGNWSPFKLMPWLHGEMDDFYVNIHSNVARKQIFTGSAREAGADLFVIGKQAGILNFGPNITNPIQRLEGQWTTMRANSGFMESISRNLNAYLDTPTNPRSGIGRVLDTAGYGQGGTGWWEKTKNFLQIGRQPQPTDWQKLRSIATKMTDPSYPAVALKNVYDAVNLPGIGTPNFVHNQPGLVDSIKSLTGFLNRTGSIDSEVISQAVKNVGTNNADLDLVLGNLGNDAAILNFFKTKGFTAKSGNLSRLLEEFKYSPHTVLGMREQQKTASPLLDALLGAPDIKTGLDFMREAITEEYVTRTFAGGQLLPEINKIIGSANEHEWNQAQAKIFGSLLKEANAETAFHYMVNNQGYGQEIRQTAQYMVNKHLSIFDTFLKLPDQDLSNKLLVREHAGIISTINQTLQQGGNVFDILRNFGTSPAIRQYTTSFFRGIDDPASMTKSSLLQYFFESRLNEAIAPGGLGLNPESLGSSWGIMRGLIFQRILPVAAAVEAWKYINYESENLTGTSPKDWLANARANWKLTWARMGDWERFNQLHPGMDMYLAGKNVDDMKDQLESGYVPVRKGRLWSFGTRSPIYGERVNYWLPDPYQISKSNWESAPNADEASSDYFAHAPYPTLRYPAAPLRKLLSPYWWENRHATGENAERPFIFSGDLATKETLWGPAINATIGKVLKPRRLLHPEYLPPEMGGTMNVESRGNLEATNRSIKAGGSGIFGVGSGDAVAVAPPGSIATITAAGQVQLQEIPEGQDDPQSLGRAVKYEKGRARKVSRRSLERLNRTLRSKGSALVKSRGRDITEATELTEENINELQTISNLEMAGYLAREHAGLYGWMAGLPLGERTGTVIADAGRAYSAEHKFWEANLGGLGGIWSEIGRRFMPHRLRNIHEYNPVPSQFENTWLPDSNYFLNLEQGDPYCVSPDTLIEIDNLNFKEAKDVINNDLITTHLGRILPVEQHIKRSIAKDEGVYKLHITSLASIIPSLSENHPVLVIENPRRSSKAELFKHKWVLTKNLKVGQYVVYPKPKRLITTSTLDLGVLTDYPKTDKYIYISGRTSLGFATSYEWLETSDVIKFDYGDRQDLLDNLGVSVNAYSHARRAILNNQDVERLPRYIPITENIGYLIGLYLAEGWTTNGEVRFSLHSKEQDLFNKALLGALEIDSTVSSSFTPIKETNGATGRLGSQVLSKLLYSLVGKGSKSKCLSEVVWKFADNILLSIIKGYVDGDGCVLKKKTGHGSILDVVSITTANKLIALQIRKILLSLNIIATICNKKPRISLYKGKPINSGFCYTLTISGNYASKLLLLLGEDNYEQKIKSSAWSYIDDDYIYLRINKIEEDKETKTVLGFQVGIDDSFCVAGFATHNSKIDRGLLRLPSESYERIHGMKFMQTRASSLGKDVVDQMLAMLHVEQPMSDYGEYATETGTKWHQIMQRKWAAMGVLEGKELEVYDEKLGISGHLDAILNINGERTVVDIKTMSGRKFHMDKKFQEHQEQLNFYMYETGIHQGALVYINRDNPLETRVEAADYNPLLFQHSLSKVAEARKNLQALVDSGDISRAQLYDPTTRFEILSDVAPWSMEYEELSHYLANNDQITDAQRERVIAARKRATIQKHKYNLYPYRFATADVVAKTFKVERIIDANTIKVVGSDHPLRLAGVRVSNERIIDEYGDPVGDQTPAEMMYAQFGIVPGAKVKALLNADPESRYADDLMQTQRAVLIKGFTNINRALLNNEVGMEKQEWTPAGVWARFSKSEIQAGAKWESMAHADSMFNTKFLKVRSPVEEYERSQAYGTCLLPDTIIYTSRGYIPIEDVTVGDHVISDTGNLRTVIDITSQDISGVSSGHVISLSIAFNQNQQSTTPEHQYLIVKPTHCYRTLEYNKQYDKYLYSIRKNRSRVCLNNRNTIVCSGCTDNYYSSYSPKWVEAKDISKGDYVLLPRFLPYTEVTSIQTSSFLSGNYTAVGEFYYSYSNQFTTTTSRNSKGLPVELKLTKELGVLLGFYLAEGSLCRRNGKPCGIKFAFHRNEESYIQEVVSNIKSVFGGNAKVDINHSTNCTVIYFSNTLVGDLFSNMCGFVKNKHINTDIKNGPVEFLTALCSAYFAGDGHDFNDATTVCKQLAYDIKECLWRLGIFAEVTYRKRIPTSKISGRLIKSCGDTYEVKLPQLCVNLFKELCGEDKIDYSYHTSFWMDDVYFYFKVLDKTESKLENILVYDLCVDKDPSFSTETCIVHNSGGSWDHPIKTHLKPTIEAYMARNPLAAGISMGVLTSLFFRQKNIRWKAAGIGAAVGFLGSLMVHGSEIGEDSSWVPGRVQKRRDIEEYYDILEYMKYRALYEKTRQLARKEEGIDVDDIADRANNFGKWRKEKLEALEEKKRKILVRQGDDSPILDDIQEVINNLKGRSDTYALGPIGTQAMLYRQRYQSTMYGAQPGGPFLNILRAIPKYERELLSEAVLHSTPEERERLYKLLPNNQKRLLGPHLGIDHDRIPKRQRLRDYFRNHTLPDEDWEGWNPNVDLDDLKTRTVKAERVDPIEFGLYPINMSDAEANTEGIEIPTVHGSSADIQDSLNTILSGKGFKNFRVEVMLSPDRALRRDNLDVDFKIRQDRHNDLRQALNEE